MSKLIHASDMSEERLLKAKATIEAEPPEGRE